MKHLQNPLCPDSHAPGTEFHFPVFFSLSPKPTVAALLGCGVRTEQCPACRLTAQLQQETDLSWGKAAAPAFLSRESACQHERTSLELFVSLRSAAFSE